MAICSADRDPQPSGPALWKAVDLRARRRMSTQYSRSESESRPRAEDPAFCGSRVEAGVTMRAQGASTSLVACLL